MTDKKRRVPLGNVKKAKEKKKKESPKWILFFIKLKKESIAFFCVESILQRASVKISSGEKKTV